MSKKTDIGKIDYPDSISKLERFACRRIITTVAEAYYHSQLVIVACSGGIDSTVLVHALGQAMNIKPKNSLNRNILATAVYLNHHLRPNDVQKESDHVENITKKYLSYVTPSISLDVKKGPGLQERARDARYTALLSLAHKDNKTRIMTAHNSNDNAETKLFQFIKGRKVSGIPATRILQENVILVRPLLNFSRQEIENYAKIFNLTWCEDISNQTDNYTRNKIRHHLIPWIEANVNPGVVKTLNREIFI